MGLAERFKEELKSKNIFEKSNIEKNLEKEKQLSVNSLMMKIHKLF